MSINRLSLFLLLLIVGGAHGQVPNRAESSPWKMYSVDGEDFSVALPILPAMNPTEEFLLRIQKTRKIYQLGAYADGVVYVIHVFENPEPRQSLESFIKERTADVTVDRDLIVSGFHGKGNRDGTQQFFATKDRLYEFMAFGAPADDPRITKFFSSFSLHRRKGSINVPDGPGLPFEPSNQPDTTNGEAPTVFTGKQVDKKARLGTRPEPRYTEAARQNQVTGTVVLKCVFAANGSVTNIRTVSGLPFGLTEKAIDAARKIKFIPAMKDGKYVSMWMQLEYNFNLY